MKARKIPKENRLSEEALLDVFYDTDLPDTEAAQAAIKGLTDAVEDSREIINGALDDVKEQLDELLDVVREETFCLAYQLGYSDGRDAAPDADEPDEEEEPEEPDADEEGWI